MNLYYVCPLRTQRSKHRTLPLLSSILHSLCKHAWMAWDITTIIWDILESLHKRHYATMEKTTHAILHWRIHHTHCIYSTPHIIIHFTNETITNICSVEVYEGSLPSSDVHIHGTNSTFPPQISHQLLPTHKAHEKYSTLRDYAHKLMV